MYRKIEVITATQRVTIEIPTDVNQLRHMYDWHTKERRRLQRVLNSGSVPGPRDLGNALRLQTAICQTLGNFVANAK